jgi:hypothetical protein
MLLDEKKQLLVLHWDSESSASWRGFPAPEVHASTVSSRAEGEERISLQQCLEAMQQPQQLSVEP